MILEINMNRQKKDKIIILINLMNSHSKISRHAKIYNFKKKKINMKTFIKLINKMLYTNHIIDENKIIDLFF